MDDARLLAGLTPQARNEPDSGIVKAAMYGFGRPGIIPLWSGEGNLPTPGFICKAAEESLARGETFYTYQRGIPELEARAMLTEAFVGEVVERIEHDGAREIAAAWVAKQLGRSE